MSLDREQPINLSLEGLDKCYGCGQNNPFGLKLQFRCDEDKAEAEFIPGELHQGWPGIVHGGIICALLDEAMGYAVYPHGIRCLTAKVEVRFKHPALIGDSLVVTATIARRTSRLVETSSVITRKDGTIVAEGKSTMYVISQDK